MAQREHKKSASRSSKRPSPTRVRTGRTRRRRLLRRTKLMVIGDVSSSKLTKTACAKSTYDAAWGTVRHQLSYKANVCVSTHRGLLVSASQAVNGSPVSRARPVVHAPGSVQHSRSQW